MFYCPPTQGSWASLQSLHHPTSVTRKVLGEHYNKFKTWFKVDLWLKYVLATKPNESSQCMFHIFKCNFESSLHRRPGGMSPWHCIATEAGRNKKTSWSQSGLLIHRLVLRKHKAGRGYSYTWHYPTSIDMFILLLFIQSSKIKMQILVSSE